MLSIVFFTFVLPFGFPLKCDRQGDSSSFEKAASALPLLRIRWGFRPFCSNDCRYSCRETAVWGGAFWRAVAVGDAATQCHERTLPRNGLFSLSKSACRAVSRNVSCVTGRLTKTTLRTKISPTA